MPPSCYNRRLRCVYFTLLCAEQAWGLDTSATKILPNVATTTYTDFLLETAAGRISGGVERDAGAFEGESKKAIGKNSRLAAFTIAAMTPCMRLYAFLGCQLQGYSPGRGLKTWIDTYSSDNFKVLDAMMFVVCDSLHTGD